MGTSLPGILDDQKGKKFNSTNDVCSLIQTVKILEALLKGSDSTVTQYLGGHLVFHNLQYRHVHY